MNVFLAVLWKDLLTEWRSRDRAVAMLLFSLLVVVIFHFSLPGGATAQMQSTAPGLLWVAIVFASILGLNRAFSLELENDALSGMALLPSDRGWIFLGKATANLLVCWPGVMVGALYVVNPDYIRPLWETPEGHTMMMISAVMIVIGYVICRRMATIKV